MKAGEVSFQQLLNGKIQYRVPLFQRTYSWKEEHWDRLWNDILDVYISDKPRKHFIGAIVTLPIPDSPEKASKYVLIDGQQRIATLLIILAVVANKAKSAGVESLAQQIIDECLLNKYATSEDEKTKMVPTKRDRGDFQKAVLIDMPENNSQIGKAWRFFSRAIDEGDLAGKPLDLTKLKTRVTDYLDLVSITLDQDDSPYRIFESLNNTGMRLGASDLIRNHVFMRILDEKRQQELYESAWFPMQERLKGQLDGFFWRFLMKDGGLIAWDDTYNEFKILVEEKKKLESTQIPDFLTELRDYSSVYARLLWPSKYEMNPELQTHMARLNSWEVEVSYPFLLNILKVYMDGSISDLDVKAIMSMIESFVVRRIICGVPTNRLRHVFANMSEKVVLPDYVSNAREYLLQNEWPGDEEFRTKFQTARVYLHTRLARTRFILNSLEQSFEHKEPIPIDEKVTIEHIMPQTLNEPWRAMIGGPVNEIHDQWLHTIGNLTLTGYNPDMGNQPFEEKKKVFATSHYELNRSVASCAVWNEQSIKDRGVFLAERAVRIWAR